MAHGRTNIAPKNIPWAMLRTLMTEMYGGKIDDESDFNTLRALVESVMMPAAFDESFHIVKDAGLTLPTTTSWQDFMKWVNALPEREPPTYLGLPANAEKLLLVGQAREMVGNLKLIMNMLDEGEQIMAEAVN